MRHRGTKSSKPARFGGYRWYDRDTGAIDLGLLAAEASREDPPPPVETTPTWLVDIPAALPNAKPVELARLEARARRAFVNFKSTSS